METAVAAYGALTAGGTDTSRPSVSAARAAAAWSSRSPLPARTSCASHASCARPASAACSRARRGFPDAEGVLEEGVAAVKVTAQDPHDPLQTDVPRYYEVRRRELVRGRVSVGAHLLHTASAHSGADLRGQSLGV